MRSSDIFQSKFLKSADVKAKPLVAVISYCAFESVGQDKKEKPVIYFESGKPVVCNRTNFEAIEDAFGDSDKLARPQGQGLLRAHDFPGQAGGRDQGRADRPQTGTGRDE